jgi:hypothetical protein
MRASADEPQMNADLNLYHLRNLRDLGLLRFLRPVAMVEEAGVRYVALVCLALTVAVGASAQTCSVSAGAAGATGAKVPGPKLTHDPSVESVLQVARISLGSFQEASVPMQIEFRNRSSQPITALEFRFRVQYPEGEALIDEGGEDFLKGKPADARVDADSPIPPDGIYKVTGEIPLGPDGAPPIHIEAYPGVVLLADRTAVGDPRRVAQIVDDRGAEAEDLADVIGDLKRALASADPEKTLVARVAQLKRSGTQEGPYAKRAAALESYQRSARAGLQQQIDALLARQKMLAEHSTLRQVR